MKTNVFKIPYKQLGFTLLELLFVIAIMGILVSIALPKFSEYRRRAFDTRALSDLRNVASAEEVYFMDQEKYLSCTNTDCNQLPGISTLSKGVQLHVTASDNSFVAEASHKNGTGKIFNWDSDRGGLVDP